MLVSTKKGDFVFQSVDDVIDFINKMEAQEKGEIWISGEQPYPCIAVCINGNFAAINYFQNDTGDLWLSYHPENQIEVTFKADGEDWKPDANAVITINDAFLCIREFLGSYKKPACIQWQEL